MVLRVLKPFVSLITCLMLLGISSPAPCRAADTECITRPSADVALAFVRAGRVARVLVKEGDIVEAGQILLELDDKEELLRIAQLKAAAEETVNIRAAEAQWQQKKVDAAKWEEVFQKGGATEYERDHARLGAVIAELSVEQARLTHEQAVLKYQEALAQHELMSLRSPMAGRVEQLAIRAGETADALQKIVRVVNIDLLWIDAPVMLDEARNLKPGMAALVTLPANDQATGDVRIAVDGATAVARSDTGAASAVQVAGRIIHVAAVADAASGTLIVRVEIPNPSGRQAGEMVTASFPIVNPGDSDRAAVLPSQDVSGDKAEIGRAHV